MSDPKLIDAEPALLRLLQRDHGCWGHAGRDSDVCRACRRRASLIEEHFADRLAAVQADMRAQWAADVANVQGVALAQRKDAEHYRARAKAAEADRDEARERLARVEALADEWAGVDNYDVTLGGQQAAVELLRAALAPQEARSVCTLCGHVGAVEHPCPAVPCPSCDTGDPYGFDGCRHTPAASAPQEARDE